MKFKTLMSSRSGFIPRTQAQALRCFSERILGPEFYINRAVNIHPIFEEPWDVQEIDRLLAKPDLDVETQVLLMSILERMVKLEDKELALFAAESITALEQRYLVRIQKAKKAFEAEKTVAALREIIDQYRTLGKLSFARPVLKAFYLAEARRYHEQNRGLLKAVHPDYATYIRILLEAQDLEAAGKLIAALLKRYPDDPRLRYLAAEQAFMVGAYRDVAAHLGCLGEGASGDVPGEMLAFWGATGCHG